MHPIDDATLVNRLRAGDETAFELMVRTYGGRLLAVARGLLRHDDDAQDCVQSAYISAFKGLATFNGGCQLSTWLHRIVVNAALMKLRTRRRKPEESIEPLLPTFLEDGHHAEDFSEWAAQADRLLEAKETGSVVRSAISGLPESYRTVLVLRDYPGAIHGRGRDKAGGHFERREDPVCIVRVRRWAPCFAPGWLETSPAARHRSVGSVRRRHMTTTPAAPADPFAFHIGPQTCLARAATAAARPILSKLLGLGRLRDSLSRRCTAGGSDWRCTSADLRGVHPAAAQRPSSRARLGRRRDSAHRAAHRRRQSSDWCARWPSPLIEAIRAVRSDVRLLANHLLARIPELAESCFFVDPFGGADARSRSLSGMRAAHLWLRRGGVLVVFPAGEVAWQRDPETDVIGGNRTPVDSQWDSSVGRLALATAASVLPVYLTGHNSRFFYFAGRVHPRLRTVLLGRELLRHRRSTVILTSRIAHEI